MYKYLIILIMSSSQALANGSETGHNNGNGHHSHSGDSPGVVVDNANTNQNSASAYSDSRAGATATGRSDASATASGGQGTASTGAITVGGGDITISEDNDYPASTAATLYTAACQSGLSGQTRSGGFGVINRDQFCDYLIMAELSWRAYQRELKNPQPEHCETVKAEINCPMPGFVDCEITTCKSPYAAKYLDDYHDNLSAAQQLLAASKPTSVLDRIAGQLFKPGAILAALFLL